MAAGAKLTLPLLFRLQVESPLSQRSLRSSEEIIRVSVNYIFMFERSPDVNQMLEKERSSKRLKKEDKLENELYLLE